MTPTSEKARGSQAAETADRDCPRHGPRSQNSHPRRTHIIPGQRDRTAIFAKPGPRGRRTHTFIVSHRLTTVANADLIIVLGDGQILEQGTHAELIGNGGEYAEMYRRYLGLDDTRQVG